MTFDIILYVHKKNKSGESPVIVQSIINRKVKRISLGYSCYESQWSSDVSRFNTTMPRWKQLNSNIAFIEDRLQVYVDDCVKGKLIFNYADFKSMVRPEVFDGDIVQCFDQDIESLQRRGKYSTAKARKNSISSMIEYFGSKKILFSSVSTIFLKKWDTHMVDAGLSESTISLYMRNVRTVYNQAIFEGIVPAEFYPFSRGVSDKGKYKIRTPDRNPRPLSFADINKIKNIRTAEYPDLQDSILYFLFSYFARGINLKDIANLTTENIVSGRIEYYRAKTIGRPVISIPVRGEIKIILDYFAHKSSEKYLFPVFNHIHKTERQRIDRLDSVRKRINHDLSVVRSILHIGPKITFYTARHTYAQVLKDNDVSVEIIQHNLNHKDLKTTKHYLKSLPSNFGDKTDGLL